MEKYKCYIKVFDAVKQGFITTGEAIQEIKNIDAEYKRKELLQILYNGNVNFNPC